ncbi:hypothetical protein CLV78_109157 [Aliiruegeria haliotis]|uniref:Porin n=1 Tax=Aliiruegeria haliotis TaxID=1280846 RepID=A0A2T0RK33_9RHOB|nr:porin [Aliiruegeria haliotis]PRY21544.1 hypothetical protein CLV78_109157 [Aliiruegeria haliotis]
MTAIRAHIQISAGAVLLAASAAHADPLTYDDGAGTSIRGYGQLSPFYVQFNDGEETYGNLTDNSHSNTRVGFFVDNELGGDQLLRFNFETALGAPASSKFSQDVEPTWFWDKTRLRKIELIYEGNFGRLSVGQGEMSTDGASSPNLSGTTIASSRAVGDTAGGYFFRLDDGTLSDVKISQSHRKWDGSRRLRLRYDTPTFGGSSDGKGFYLSAAYGKEVLAENNDDTYYDAAIRLQDTYGDWSVKGSAGYGWIEQTDKTSEYWSGAISTLHLPTGLNATIAGGGDPDGGQFVFGKAGWLAELVDPGKTAFGVDYYEGKDTVYAGAESSKWGVQVVQNFDAQNLQVYLAWETYDFSDDTGNRYQDASATMAGVFWKF